MTESFDVCGPLPTGVTVLEASAGTGKTFTIAALAARYVAEGIPLEQILMVTFTRMATGELRERVRERLVSAEHGLERALAGAPPEDDAVVALLATGGPSVVALRRERLAAALADFDSATIATTHGFCQEVLGGLGVLGDIEADTTFVEDISDLRDEVVDDLYLRKFAAAASRSSAARRRWRSRSAAIDNPAAPLEPADAPDGTIEAMRVRLAGAARDELEARKRRMGVMTYDDLLTRLSDTLAGEGGAVAAARLRARYRVVLVDEFQDTDPVQWQIMQTAFGDGDDDARPDRRPEAGDLRVPRRRCLRLHRGRSHRRLRGHADDQLAQRPGPDRRLRRALRRREARARGDRLPRGPRRGGERGHAPARSAGARAAADPGRPARRRGPDPAGLRAARTRTAARRLRRRGRHRVAAASGAEIDGEGRVRPGHIAVLVRTNRNASRVRDALEAVDVPAVINGAGSVFGTDAAREWLRVLEAIERPSYPPRARSAALTTILGWTPSRSPPPTTTPGRACTGACTTGRACCA